MITDRKRKIEQKKSEDNKKRKPEENQIIEIKENNAERDKVQILETEQQNIKDRVDHWGDVIEDIFHTSECTRRNSCLMEVIDNAGSLTHPHQTNAIQAIMYLLKWSMKLTIGIPLKIILPSKWSTPILWYNSKYFYDNDKKIFQTIVKADGKIGLDIEKELSASEIKDTDIIAQGYFRLPSRFAVLRKYCNEVQGELTDDVGVVKNIWQVKIETIINFHNFVIRFPDKEEPSEIATEILECDKKNILFALQKWISRFSGIHYHDFRYTLIKPKSETLDNKSQTTNNENCKIDEKFKTISFDFFAKFIGLSWILESKSKGAIVALRRSERGRPGKIAITETINSLQEYVLYGEYEKLSEVLKKDSWKQRVNCTLTKEVGLSLLHLAVLMGSIKTCEILIANGANINAVAIDGITPLFLAISQTQIEITKLLLKDKANTKLCYANELTGKKITVFEQAERVFSLREDTDYADNAEEIRELLEQVKGTKQKFNLYDINNHLNSKKHSKSGSNNTNTISQNNSNLDDEYIYENLSDIKLICTRNGEQFQILPVLGDGDCGYTALGMTRDQAYKLLNENTNDNTVRNLLKNLLKEALLQNAFKNYLNKNFFKKEVPINFIEQNIDKLSEELNTAQHYIDFDVKEKKIDLGWPHPLILHALAHIQKFKLCIWRIDENEQLLIPHNTYQGDYSVYQPENYNPEVNPEVNIVFVNGNHFNLLEKYEKLNSKASVTQLHEHSPNSNPNFFEKGADISKLYTSLFNEIKSAKANLDKIQQIISEINNPSQKQKNTYNDATALFIAIKTKNIDIVDLVLQLEPPLDKLNTDQETVMEAAELTENKDIINTIYDIYNNAKNKANNNN